MESLRLEGVQGLEQNRFLHKDAEPVVGKEGVDWELHTPVVSSASKNEHIYTRMVEVAVLVKGKVVVFLKRTGQTDGPTPQSILHIDNLRSSRRVLSVENFSRKTFEDFVMAALLFLHSDYGHCETLTHRLVSVIYSPSFISTQDGIIGASLMQFSLEMDGETPLRSQVVCSHLKFSPPGAHRFRTEVESKVEKKGDRDFQLKWNMKHLDYCGLYPNSRVEEEANKERVICMRGDASDSDAWVAQCMCSKLAKTPLEQKAMGVGLFATVVHLVDQGVAQPGRIPVFQEVRGSGNEKKASVVIMLNLSSVPPSHSADQVEYHAMSGFIQALKGSEGNEVLREVSCYSEERLGEFGVYLALVFTRAD